MGDFNRGSTGPGRGRSLARMPQASTGEGTSGNVIPRGTTKASVRRGQALLNILNDRAATGQTFSRGSSKSGRRRNFSMMASVTLSTAAAFSVQVIAGSETRPGASVTGLVSFDSAVYDPDGMWSPPEKIICRSAGTYTCAYSIEIVPWVDSLFIEVRKNGTVAGTTLYSAGTAILTNSHSIALSLLDEVTLNIEDPNSPGTDLEIVSVEFTVTKT